MIVRKLSCKIKEFKYRSCSCKRKYNIINAYYKLIVYQIKGIKVNRIYKCMFCNRHHIGHLNGGTMGTVKKFRNHVKLLIKN